MVDELTKIISEAEIEIMSSSFDNRYYRNLITTSLRHDLNDSPLSIDILKTRFERLGNDIANKRYNLPRETIKEMKENEYIDYILNDLKKHTETLIKDFRNLADSIVEDVSKEVQKNLDKVKSVVEEMKKGFADKLTKEGEEYLAKLEKDMTEKSAVLKQLDNIISCISELSTLYR